MTNIIQSSSGIFVISALFNPFTADPIKALHFATLV